MAADVTTGSTAPSTSASSPVPSVPMSLSGLLEVARVNIPKLLRFAAVSLVTVPIGMFLLWFFLRTGLRPVLANLAAVTLSTIPNYLLNRYWVWGKKGPNSVSKEIAPFWAMAFLGLALSTLLIWVADFFTDANVVFLAVQFVSFGIVWLFKFFVIETFLFGSDSPEMAKSPS